MIDLSKISGLPMELTDDFRVKFNPPMDDREPTYVREFSQVTPFLQNPDVAPPPYPPYIGYRQLYLPEDKEFVEAQRLQYDLTILPPIFLGKEFNKTIGHYHADVPGTKVAHPEMYEILHGQATLLMQKMDEKFEKILDVIYFEVKTGDKIIYPPNYGHILINTGREALVTGNWLSVDYKPLYEPVKEKHGLVYYFVVDSAGSAEFVKNENYSEHPSLRKVSPNYKSLEDMGFMKSEPMYNQARRNPNMMAFLQHPENYVEQLSVVCS